MIEQIRLPLRSCLFVRNNNIEEEEESTTEFHGLPTYINSKHLTLFSVYILLPYVELTWVGSVPFTTNLLVENIICKGTWFPNIAILVWSPQFTQFQCLHKSVSGFSSSILLAAWLPGWPGLERQPGFDLYYNKHQKPFTFPRRGSFGVIHSATCIQGNASRHTAHWICPRYFLRLWNRIPIFDLNKRSLIVFDDQMIDASKDKRTVDLFTRGSYHRNLSVIFFQNY